MNENLIELADVEKRFASRRSLLSFGPRKSVRAVRNVSFSISENEIVAIVGESGSGKTSLGNLILDIDSPTAGNVKWLGTDIASLSKGDYRVYRRNVQAVFQNPYASLNPRQTIRSILRKPLEVHHVVSREAIDAEIAKILEFVGLSDTSLLDRYPHEFSGGQRQRIAIARALSLRPKLIVADEPVAALDVSVRAQVLDLLLRLKERFKLSLVFITHDLGVVRHIADRIAVMYLGRIVEEGTNDAFFAGPRHPYSRLLLRSSLSPDPSRRPTAELREVGEPPTQMRNSSGCHFRSRCPVASDICADVEPYLKTTPTGTRAACHLAG